MTQPTTTVRIIDVFDYGQLYHRTTEETPPTEFIGGWFARKHVSILASKSGIGKTWYLIKLIADLSKGGTIFLEQAYFEPPRKILFFVGETNIALVNERFSKMRDDRNADNIIMVSYIEAAKLGCELDLDDYKENDDCGFRNITNIISAVKPDLVIFDTMMSFRADDENSAQSTRNMLIRLQKIADEYNVAVLATHHLRKTDKKERRQSIDQDEIIGSSALVRLAGAAFIMAKHYQAIEITCVKSWWEVPPKLLYKMIKLDNDQLTFELARDDENITEARLRAERYAQIQFDSGAQLTAEQVSKACNVSRATALFALENVGQVIMMMPGNTSEKIYGKK